MAAMGCAGEAKNQAPASGLAMPLGEGLTGFTLRKIVCRGENNGGDHQAALREKCEKERKGRKRS